MENNITNDCCSSHRIFWIMLPVALVALTGYLLVAMIAGAKEARYAGKQPSPQNTITVSGTGEAYASPNLAVMTFSVVSEAPTVTAAMQNNTAKMNAVINAVKQYGVDAKDLQTSGFNVNPHYDYVREIPAVKPAETKNGKGSSSSSAEPETDIARSAMDNPPVSSYIAPDYPGKRTLTGYEITQSLTVKVRNLETIGQIIEKATEAGSNQIGNLQFIIDKPDELQNQARTEAIAKAKQKAQTLAGQLGVKLARIVNFSENSYVPSARMDYYAKEVSMEADAGMAPQIETGQNKITASVYITYELK